MTDQVRIGDDGQLEIERTWDGEPLWSVETQQDELFAGDAFKQMPGQLPIEGLDIYWEPCSACEGSGRVDWGGRTLAPCSHCDGHGEVLVSIPIGGDR